MARPITDHLVVVVATEEHARSTAVCLERYGDDEITGVHVLENVDGVSDVHSADRAALAEASFDAFRDVLSGVETASVYSCSVVDTVVDIADGRAASAIAFRPRESSRVARFRSRYMLLGIGTAAQRPVIVRTEAAGRAR